MGRKHVICCSNASLKVLKWFCEDLNLVLNVFKVCNSICLAIIYLQKDSKKSISVSFIRLFSQGVTAFGDMVLFWRVPTLPTAFGESQARAGGARLCDLPPKSTRV